MQKNLRTEGSWRKYVMRHACQRRGQQDYLSGILLRIWAPAEKNLTEGWYPGASLLSYEENNEYLVKSASAASNQRSGGLSFPVPKVSVGASNDSCIQSTWDNGGLASFLTYA